MWWRRLYAFEYIWKFVYIRTKRALAVGVSVQGKDMYFVFQGYAPTKEQLAAGEYTMSRFAKLYGMNYKGMITE